MCLLFTLIRFDEAAATAGADDEACSSAFWKLFNIAETSLGWSGAELSPQTFWMLIN